MRIGFDGRYAEGNLVGVGKYIQSLIIELSKLGVECVIFYSNKPEVEIKGKNIKSVILHSENRYLFEQALLPAALKKEKVDLYHATGNVGVPVFCPVPAVLTIHDIIPLEIKDYFSYSPAPFLSKLSYISRLKSSLLKSVRIVTVSNFVKRELVKKMGVPSEKITTIYSGTPNIIKGGKLPKELTGKKYILNNGGIDIRKNLDRLIEAYQVIHKKYPDVYLVITSENSRMKKDLETLTNKRGLSKFVLFTGYVDDKSLTSIVRSSFMVCYPTLSEGFGFPILEGFGNGVPVVSSNTSSLPEVSGSAALLVNPKNVGEIAGAMEKILTDKKLRDRMVLKGKGQYNMFSWAKTAHEYLDLYNHI